MFFKNFNYLYRFHNKKTSIYISLYRHFIYSSATGRQLLNISYQHAAWQLFINIQQFLDAIKLSETILVSDELFN